MKKSELAYRAAEIISEKGHAKKDLQDEEGRVCLAGALNFAKYGDAGIIHQGMSMSHVDPQLCDILMVVGKLLEDELPDVEQLCRPVDYNDSARTSAEDVILKLKQAGAILEADENPAA